MTAVALAQYWTPGFKPWTRANCSTLSACAWVLLRTTPPVIASSVSMLKAGNRMTLKTSYQRSWREGKLQQYTPKVASGLPQGMPAPVEKFAQSTATCLQVPPFSAYEIVSAKGKGVLFHTHARTHARTHTDDLATSEELNLLFLTRATHTRTTYLKDDAKRSSYWLHCAARISIAAVCLA